jgi:two-component system aerobic respiration control sensor histidine kinase ArcB
MTVARPTDFDPTRLAWLVGLVRPDEAKDLIAQLTADLSAGADQMAVATPARDWLRLREASHTLIALAGYTGAVALQRLAETLNAIAHAQDPAALDRVWPEAATELSALIMVVRNWQPAEAAP